MAIVIPLHHNTIAPSHKTFAACDFAKQHLQKLGLGAIAWIQENPCPTSLEHLIFRMGNQLFLVHVSPCPFTRITYDETTFLNHSYMAGAIPCLVPMIEKNDGTYIPQHDSWGLIHANTLAPIIPTDMVTNELVEMSDWELEDFAVKLAAEDCQHYPDLWSGYFISAIGQPNSIVFNRPCGTYFVYVIASIS